MRLYGHSWRLALQPCALRQCDALERQLRASWAEVEGAVRSREAAALARPGDSLDLVRGADAVGAEAVESMLRAESMAMRTAGKLNPEIKFHASHTRLVNDQFLLPSICRAGPMCRACCRWRRPRDFNRSTETDESDATNDAMEKTLHQARSNLIKTEEKQVNEDEWKEALARSGLNTKQEEKVYWARAPDTENRENVHGDHLTFRESSWQRIKGQKANLMVCLLLLLLPLQLVAPRLGVPLLSSAPEAQCGAGIPDGCRHVEHYAFETVFAIAILLNVVAIGLEIDLQESTDDIVWVIVGNVFCVTWIAEAFVKIWEMRWRYFKDCLNYVDMILVVLTVADVWIIPYVTDVESNLVVFRMLRLMRLLRLVKLVQVLRRFRNLWLLVQGFAEAVTTLNWVFLMLCLIMYTFAVCLRLAVDCKGGFADWSDCEAFFGTIPRTMYTLVQVVTLESWNMTVGRPLVERQPLLFPVLLLYIFLTTFGLLNIIVGVIVENTLNIASSDQDLQDRRFHRQLLQELEFLKEVFESADSDGSGTLDREEFVEICQRPEVKNALLRMEVPAEQPEELFDILDEEGVGQISFLSFHESVKSIAGNT
eukprot:s4157_g1.t1